MLIDLATAVPPYKVDQSRASEELKMRMEGQAAVSRLINMAAKYSGIDNRFLVVPDADTESNNKFFTDEDGKHFNPDTKSRMDMYEKWSVKLTNQAVDKLIVQIPAQKQTDLRAFLNMVNRHRCCL